jgi:hypothetical protein
MLQERAAMSSIVTRRGKALRKLHIAGEEAKVWLCTCLEEAAVAHCRRPLTNDEMTFLSSSAVYRIAELFYVFRAYGIFQEAAIIEYIDRFDRDMERNIAAFNRRSAATKGNKTARLDSRASNPRRSGKTRADDFRLAMFGKAKRIAVNTILASAVQGIVSFREADLKRFMIEYMSPQHCRNSCEDLAALGLLRKDPNGETKRAIFESKGAVLEDCFNEHLIYKMLILQGMSEAERRRHPKQGRMRTLRKLIAQRRRRSIGLDRQDPTASQRL